MNGLYPLVWILLDPIITGAHITNRHSSEQLAALGLLFERRLRSLSERRHLHFADCALHPQYEPIVDLPWVIDPLSIDQQDTNDTTELQQRMPIAARARQARRLNAENGADLALAN